MLRYVRDKKILYLIVDKKVELFLNININLENIIHSLKGTKYSRK